MSDAGAPQAITPRETFVRDEVMEANIYRQLRHTPEHGEGSGGWVVSVRYLVKALEAARAGSLQDRRPQEPIELGRLLDLLEEVATLVDDGAVAPTETMKCVYRDVVDDAIRRLRAAAPAPPPQEPLASPREVILAALDSVLYVGTAGDIILEICGHHVRLKHESTSEIGVDAIAAVHRMNELRMAARAALLPVPREPAESVESFVHRVRDEAIRLGRRYKLSSAAATQEAFNALAAAPPQTPSGPEI